MSDPRRRHRARTGARRRGLTVVRTVDVEGLTVEVVWHPYSRSWSTSILGKSGARLPGIGSARSSREAVEATRALILKNRSRGPR